MWLGWTANVSQYCLTSSISVPFSTLEPPLLVNLIWFQTVHLHSSQAKDSLGIPRHTSAPPSPMLLSLL